jgi:dTDP-4-amino-4,6-dideoxygalactose transaminase
MKVPLLDLVAQYKPIREEVRKVVDEVLDTQRCIGGPKVTELEKAVAAYSDCKFAIGASSGTDAILNVLMSLDIGPGDEVITTPYTFFATGGCIARTGAVPVFVDINPKTYNIDPNLIEEAITDQTKAIIPVHLYGQMADMDAIMAIANRRGLAVIEDAAQSIGSTYHNRKAGSIGTAGCFSFFPSKNLGGVGDGGMIVTNDPKLAERMDIMRNHGSKPKYFHKYVGGNFRLDPLQAAVISVKLKYLPQWHEGRRSNAAYYNQKFAGCSKVVTPHIEPWNYTIYNQYVIRVPNRDAVRDHLTKKDVGCEIYYPLPLHVQECFADLGYSKGDMPHSEAAANETLALPIYPELTREMQDYVVATVLEAL